MGDPDPVPSDDHDPIPSGSKEVSSDKNCWARLLEGNGSPGDFPPSTSDCPPSVSGRPPSLSGRPPSTSECPPSTSRRLLSDSEESFDIEEEVEQDIEKLNNYLSSNEESSVHIDNDSDIEMDVNIELSSPNYSEQEDEGPNTVPEDDLSLHSQQGSSATPVTEINDVGSQTQVVNEQMFSASNSSSEHENVR